MDFVNTPFLGNGVVLLKPLVKANYRALFEIASDPLLWEYHPIRDGYTKTGFDKFFNEAIAAGSLLVIDKANDKVFGCTRIYGYDKKESSVVIGHTFISRQYWGKGYNKSIKQLMFDYVFRYVDKVVFYVVENNTRSQKALEKLGAFRVNRIVRSYENKEINCWVYEMKKAKCL
ncbi:MAG TPA: GNAT family N-acetyltransferase [Bacteroidia bacterium]